MQQEDQDSGELYDKLFQRVMQEVMPVVRQNPEVTAQEVCAVAARVAIFYTAHAFGQDPHRVSRQRKSEATTRLVKALPLATSLVQ